MINGTGEYLATALADPHLATAYAKLKAQIVEVRGVHQITQPVGPTRVMPRIMVDGDYDLTRRWSWRIHHGPIPEGHRIYVSCGDRYCVAAQCLYAYKAEKRAKGERKIVRPLAKLSWEQVREIRASGARIDELATRYDVHPTTIRAILNRRTWVR